MTSALWKQTGGIWPLGVSSSVTWLDLGAIAHMLQFARIRTVLEIGVEHGGLSAWLMAYARYNDLAYRGVDITLNALQTQLGIVDRSAFVECDAWSAAAVNAARAWLEINPAPALIICDGGNKPKELHLYAPLLRDGDILIGHDYHNEYSDDALADMPATQIHADWLDDTLLCMFVRRN